MPFASLRGTCSERVQREQLTSRGEGFPAHRVSMQSAEILPTITRRSIAKWYASGSNAGPAYRSIGSSSPCIEKYLPTHRVPNCCIWMPPDDAVVEGPTLSNVCQNGEQLRFGASVTLAWCGLPVTYSNDKPRCGRVTCGPQLPPSFYRRRQWARGNGTWLKAKGSEEDTRLVTYGPRRAAGSTWRETNTPARRRCRATKS